MRPLFIRRLSGWGVQILLGGHEVFLLLELLLSVLLITLFNLFWTFCFEMSRLWTTIGDNPFFVFLNIFGLEFFVLANISLLLKHHFNLIGEKIDLFIIRLYVVWCIVYQFKSFRWYTLLNFIWHLQSKVLLFDNIGVTLQRLFVYNQNTY